MPIDPVTLIAACSALFYVVGALVVSVRLMRDEGADDE